MKSRLAYDLVKFQYVAMKDDIKVFLFSTRLEFDTSLSMGMPVILKALRIYAYGNRVNRKPTEKNENDVFMRASAVI